MMPIVLKDFQWSENAECVFIVLEIKGVRTGSTDVVSSPTYLKVHYAPFIFEVFLRNEVDDTLSVCTIDEDSGKVSFRLKKSFVGLLWEKLEELELTKEEKTARRLEAVQLTQQRHEKEKSEKQKRNFDRKQVIVHDQIELDAKLKEDIAKTKTFESSQVLADFNGEALAAAAADDNEKAECNKGQEKGSGDNMGNNKGGKIKEKVNSSKTDSNQIFDVAETELEQSMVGIRQPVSLSIKFTPRIFPTPSRESKHVEEQEWLKKQAEARRLCGFVDEDLRPEEKNPQWLLDKGLSLMRTESYKGAISAFSLGISIAPKMPELYVERAGAHLAIKNYQRTVDDCSHALELLTPHVKANEEDRLKCHVRRASAFRELEMWVEAVADYNYAIPLNPQDKDELVKIRDEILAKCGIQTVSDENPN